MTMKKKRFLSLLLSLALVPGLSMTAYATTYSEHVMLRDHQTDDILEPGAGIEFTAWTSADSLPDTAGSYYLTQDVTLSNIWSVPTGTVNLCLNGKHITNPNRGIAVQVDNEAATLQLYDYQGGGAIQDSGIGVHVKKGAFNMYGGSIQGNICTGDGGGVLIDGGGSFNMYGGKITGNRANRGGGVAVTYGSFAMSGGEISGNSVRGYGNDQNIGGGVYVGGTFKVSGTAKIFDNKNKEGNADNVYLSSGNSVIVAGTMADGAHVNIHARGPVKADDGYTLTETDAEKFHDDDGATYLLNGEGELSAAYEVTCGAADNGTASVGRQLWLVNETVSVTVSPAEGYMLDSLTYHIGTGAPQNIEKNGQGEYTFTMPAADVTVSATFKEKTDSMVVAAPTANNRTYDGTRKPLLNSDGEVSGGTLQYALGDANGATESYTPSIPTASNAGTYYVWYKVTGDSNHNDTASAVVTVHIYSSGAYISKAPTAKYLFYTGEAQELVEAGTAGGGTMRYALGTDTETIPQEFTYTLPTGTEAGTYYVWYKVSGDWNHYDTAAACITVTIYPAGDDEESMPHYDGTPQPLVKPGTIEGGTIEYALGTSDQEAPAEGWSEEIPTGVNPGEYYVWYRIKGDANHNDVAPACVKVTLGKAFIDPVVSLTGWTYGQQANGPTVEGNTGTGTVEYLYSSEEEGEYTKEVPVNAGTYYVKASVAETEYYRAGVSKPLSFAISKASINIQAVNKTSKLGGKLKKLTYKVTGDYVLGDKLGIKLKTTAKKAKAGKYKITVSWNKNPNYQVKLIKGTYTVKDRITKAEKKAAKKKLDKGLKVTAKGNKLTVQWGAVSKAGRYEVWAAYKGSKAYRKVGTVKGSVRKYSFSKLNGKKLNLKKGVHVYVKVYRKVDKKMTLITKSKVKTIKR